MTDRLAVAVQRCYPEIYLACHVEHTRARSTPYQLSAKDSRLLSHLDENAPVMPGELARHLGVAASTLSESLQRIEAQGYLSRTPQPGNRRRIELRLTPQGARAMKATSTLDYAHVRGLLARLTPRQQRQAVAGLELLARAAAEHRGHRQSSHTRQT